MTMCHRGMGNLIALIPICYPSRDLYNVTRPNATSNIGPAIFASDERLAILAFKHSLKSHYHTFY